MEASTSDTIGGECQVSLNEGVRKSPCCPEGGGNTRARSLTQPFIVNILMGARLPSVCLENPKTLMMFVIILPRVNKHFQRHNIGRNANLSFLKTTGFDDVNTENTVRMRQIIRKQKPSMKPRDHHGGEQPELTFTQVTVVCMLRLKQSR